MKISVIIPAYNAERYIAKAIESCLSQTYAPSEIIVIDDGSTDGTAAVAESFPSPVRVIRLAENMGVSVARNRGVQASTGDWIAFLDADDWFLPEKLERQRRCALENEKAVLIYTAFRLVSLDGSESAGRFFSPSELLPMLRYRCPIHLSTVALRRDAFDSVGGFDPTHRTAQDWDLWLKIAARYSVKLFAAVPEPLAVYRRVAGSLSSSAMRYFHERKPIMESSCLCGSSGISRFLWRQRILAYNYYDTSIALREEGSPLDLPFILMSIALWPIPVSGMSIERYKIAAVMVKQHLLGCRFISTLHA
jgi:glycosyltransferase involved in cell wall biosynthesis